MDIEDAVTVGNLADEVTARVCCGQTAMEGLALLLLLATVVPTLAFGPPL